MRSSFARIWSKVDYEKAEAWVAKLPPELPMPFTGNWPQKIVLGPPPGLKGTSYVSNGQHVSISANPKDVKIGDLSAQAFADLAKSDPGAASKMALALKDSTEREKAVRSLVFNWAKADPSSALAWLRARPEAEIRQLREGIISILAEQELEIVRQAAESTQDTEERRMLGLVVVNQLARRDVDKAIAFLQSMPPEDRRQAIAAYQAWAEREPAQALASYREVLSPEVASQPFLYSPAIRLMLGPAMTKNPAGVAAAVLDLDPLTRSDALYEVGLNWCRSDSAGAISWANALPAGPAHDEALRQFVSVWATHDSSQSVAFVNSLPAGSGKTAAIEGFATATFDLDPNAALAWIRTIPDEKERIQALNRAMVFWQRKNGAGKIRWQQEVTDLSPEEARVVHNPQIPP
jgi:hypothetical protein